MAEEKTKAFLKEELSIETGLSEKEIHDYIATGLLSIGIARSIPLGIEAYDYIARPGLVSAKDMREQMSNQLVRRGYASMDEVLTASYGEWPPKGLDIVMKNEQVVKFNSILDKIRNDPSLSPLKKWAEQINTVNNTYGSAETGGARIIKLNNLRLQSLPGLLGKSALASTLGHEGVHILQGDHAYRAPSLYNKTGDLLSTLNRNLMVIDIKDPMTAPFAEHTDTSIFETFSSKRRAHHAYLRDGAEAQARIHEIMMSGYQKWGQLPNNREQFLVAMESSGIDVPKHIMQ
jgi:hypothetical protein